MVRGCAENGALAGGPFLRHFDARTFSRRQPQSAPIHRWRRQALNGSGSHQIHRLTNVQPELLLGGFTIAAALSKHAIDRILATKVMRLAGRKPRNVLLANMLIAGFASMWITNVAAPTLCLQLMRVSRINPFRLLNQALLTAETAAFTPAGD